MNEFKKFCIPCKHPLIDFLKTPQENRYKVVCLNSKCPISKKIYMQDVFPEEVELFEAQLKKS